MCVFSEEVFGYSMKFQSHPSDISNTYAGLYFYVWKMPKKTFFERNLISTLLLIILDGFTES